MLRIIEADSWLFLCKSGASGKIGSNPGGGGSSDICFCLLCLLWAKGGDRGSLKLKKHLII